MTSALNHYETIKFFEDNLYFGGDKNSFVFFQQSVLPAVDLNGKIIMKSKCFEISKLLTMISTLWGNIIKRDRRLI